MEEFETLSDSEKASSIRSKIKNIQYQKYNLELDLLSEKAIQSPSASVVAETELQIANIEAREAALKAELHRVFPENPPSN